jgi:hypothetical protein
MNLITWTLKNSIGEIAQQFTVDTQATPLPPGVTWLDEEINDLIWERLLNRSNRND